MPIGYTDQGDVPGFISPHLDDAVLSCASAIRHGSPVVTVFASGPRPVELLPAWDRSCGFADGDDVAGTRTAEDDAALERFGAHGVRLEFWPLQYRRGRTVEPALVSALRARLLPRPKPDPRLVDQVADQLGRMIAESEIRVWFAPVGVGHMDHRITAGAVMLLARSRPDLTWVLYEDLPYAQQEPDLLKDALRQVKRAGFTSAMLEIPAGDDASKRAAVGCYATQLLGLGAGAGLALRGPERFHQLL